jgi:hypothetical protein
MASRPVCAADAIVASLTDFRAGTLLGETPNGEMPERLNGKSLDSDF